MRHHIPNIITTLRIVAIIPICWLLWEERYTAAFILLVLAGLSDALDGYLARRNQWITKLGGFLDPVADKLFIIAITVVFGLQGHIPWWLVWLIIGRDLVIIAGAGLFRWVTGDLAMRPLWISKINTGLQIGLLAITLLHVAFYALPPIVPETLQFIVAITTVLSGISYVVTWSYLAFVRK